MKTISKGLLAMIVATAADAGVPVVAHAVSKEGMRRAAEAGMPLSVRGDLGDWTTLVVQRA